MAPYKEKIILFYLLAPAEVNLHLMHHLDVQNVDQQNFKKSKMIFPALV
jgi:hypothetical protein